MKSPKAYYNILEEIVEMEYDRNEKSLDCCHCERCKNDIIAYSLSNVTPKYVVSHEGELFSKISALHTQVQTDIIRLLIQAAQIVKENPRH